MQFTGYQISGYKRYQVTVNLKTVDLPKKDCTSLSPHLSGFLSIRGLTNQHPEISTYFEAYAVNHKELGFLSSSWKDEPVLNEFKATDQTDLEHWINFPSFRQLFLMSQKTVSTQLTTMALQMQPRSCLHSSFLLHQAQTLVTYQEFLAKRNNLTTT